MTPAVLFEGEPFADYFQILLVDAETGPAAEVWTDEDVRRGLLVAPGCVVVAPARNMPVPLRVVLLDAPPAVDPAADHVVEASITAPSGTLLVYGATEDVTRAPRLAVPAAPLRLRFSSVGRATLSEDGLDGNDRYLVELWPAPAAPVVLHRVFEPG